MGNRTDTEVLARWTAAAMAIAQQAAGRIMAIYSADIAVTAKADHSPLTEADLASHAVICAQLLELAPDIPILSEESSGVAFSERSHWQRFWLVDPLDGTKEFINRNGQFTVNIALIEDHRPVLGVVQVPAQDQCYFAWDGGGAQRRGADGKIVSIHTRRTQAGRLVLAGSRSHGSADQERFFQALGENVEILSMGSSLKFCLVAEGKVDLYPRFGPTSEWDTAAAHCVVEQAGGSVTGVDLEPLRYNTRDSWLNPHFLVIGDREFDWLPFLQRAGLA
ncbi:MAG: 3'(2'),5'-bisphosphate nucleotidase [Gammaproteobacteria bacterium RIFCSPLOWO2_02_FULL_61_13]|nr:MAG: 3'(2'),5'-bisphosphate nucleotidase [Gammaproteobacteria bacterium RIFCSPLOWO2_02_FULL_61_13]